MRAVRVVHRWLGLLLAAPLLLQGLSGAILTIEPTIPSFRASAPPGGARAGANRLLERAQAAAPAGARLMRYVPAPDDGGEVIVQMARAGERLTLRLDPATAEPLGPAAPEAGALAWIRRLHENWLVPQWGGRQFAGWLGVGLLIVTVLGVPLWWPRGRWRDGFTVPLRARGLQLHRRLHSVAGIFVSALLLATSVTGIAQGFPGTARAVLGLPAGGGRGGAEHGKPPPRVDLEAALRLAAEAAPGTTLRMASLPASAAEPVRLLLAPPGTEGVSSLTTVAVDAGATRVLSVSRPEALTRGERVLRWAHDLHFGQGFGAVWRLLTALTGLALPLFAVTGLLMWLGRRRVRRRVAALREAAVQQDMVGGVR